MNRKIHNQGISLITMLIAMAIGTWLLASVWKLTSSFYYSWRYQLETIDMHQNARIALDLLTSKIKLSGYTGCSQKIDVANLLTSEASNRLWMARAPLGILGITDIDKSVKSIDKSAISEALITFNFNAEDLYTITASTSNVFQLDRRHNYRNGDLLGLIMPNCSQIAIFQAGRFTKGSQVFIESIKSSGLYNCTHKLQGNFNCQWQLHTAQEGQYTDSMLISIEAYAFYIKNYKNVPTLYQKPAGEYPKGGTKNTEALVEGIEKIKILYGIDTDNDHAVNQYMDSKTIGIDSDLWKKVIIIELEIIVRSFTEIAKTPQTYVFSGEIITPKDKYLRHSYTTTIVLKNRI